MNKIKAIIFTGFLILAMSACTPERITDTFNPQACCGEVIPTPPPPPPTDSIPDN
tara:strand:- start:4058 stop:4222 length:165 start_codon:yes stop_codon:yes gene_type:complete